MLGHVIFKSNRSSRAYNFAARATSGSLLVEGTIEGAIIMKFRFTAGRDVQ